MNAGMAIKRAHRARNWQPNPTFSGASPGVAPDGWSLNTAVSGITSAFVGVGEDEDGRYLELSFSGTNNSGSHASIRLNMGPTVSTIPASARQTWKARAKIKRSTGSIASPLGVQMLIVERDAAGAFLVDGVGPQILNQGQIQPVIHTRVLTHASTTRIGQRLAIEWPAGHAATFVLRLYAPQLQRAR